MLLTRIMFLVLLSTVMAPAAFAQLPSPASGQRLDAALVPGSTVWITGSDGQEEKARIIDLSGDIVTAIIDRDTRRLRTTDVARVRARDSDSVLNSALIGAGVAISAGLSLCTVTEPWRNCRDDFAAISRIGALGAGIGIGIDLLIRGRQTIYEATARSTRIRAAPIFLDRSAGRSAGLRLSLRF